MKTIFSCRKGHRVTFYKWPPFCHRRMRHRTLANCVTNDLHVTLTENRSVQRQVPQVPARLPRPATMWAICLSVLVALFILNFIHHTGRQTMQNKVNKQTNWIMIWHQGVALTGRNTTGPPSRAAPWWIALHMRRRGVLQTTTDAREQNNTAPTLCEGGPVIALTKCHISHTLVQKTQKGLAAYLQRATNLCCLFVPTLLERSLPKSPTSDNP